MLTKITPVAKSITLGRKKLALAALGCPYFTVSDKKLDGELSRGALNELYKGLSALVGVSAESANGEIPIKLEISNRVPEAIEKNVDQAYKIVVNKSGVSLIG